jgi:hypothetical protein
MVSSSDNVSPPDTGGTSGRRDFMRKAVVGTSAFVVPTIITVDPADAQALTSPPPEPPGQAESPPAETGGAPATVSRRAPGTNRNPAGGGRAELPSTGANLDRLVAAGLAATAGGAALVLWSAEARVAGATSGEKKPTDASSQAVPLGPEP